MFNTYNFFVNYKLYFFTSSLVIVVILFFYNSNILNESNEYFVVRSSSSSFECNPINENYLQYSVNISNKKYPFYLSLHKNESINFQCLNRKTNIKVILFWNTFFGHEDYYYGLGKIEPFKLNKCPVDKCELTTDKSKLKYSDFVITHMRDTLDLPKIMLVYYLLLLIYFLIKIFWKI